MAIIGTRTFLADGVKPYITVGSEEYVRPLAMGTNWTKIRIAMLVSIVPNGINNIANGGVIMGVCSGTSAPYGAASTTNFIGASYASVGTTLVTYTYTAGAGFPYYSIGYPQLVSKTGASVSITGQSSSVTPGFAVAGVGNLIRRGFLFVDIQKGSPNYTVTFLNSWPTSRTDLDYTTTHLVEFCESGAINATAASAHSVANTFSEAAGALDTVNIYWPRSANPLEIYSIAVARLS